MLDTLLVVALVLLVVIAALLVAVLLRQGAQAQSAERGRQSELESQRALRQELTASLQAQAQLQVSTLEALGKTQTEKLFGIGEELRKLSESNEKRLELLRTTVDGKLKELQEDNTKKLDKIRETVDEKLRGVLEKRLAESFKSVSERLEQVHRGLGEMHGLAQGVGDLKRVLTNVKTRGTWGEVQLGNLLEQLLTPEQYEADVAVKPRSQQRVEFAIKLPGREEGEEPVWLPIDSKFPIEDWLRLVEASERADPAGIEEAGKALEAQVRESARMIRDKYLSPPRTTKFGILFLPTEGLYADVVRRTGLVEQLQRDWNVVVAGPTVLGALLNSLQMGFRTLAIERRSNEVWTILSAVKTEFAKFGDTLKRVNDKLKQASRQLEDQVGARTRAIQRKLRKVQELPGGAVPPLLVEPLAANADDEAEAPDSAADDEGSTAEEEQSDAALPGS